MFESTLIISCQGGNASRDAGDPTDTDPAAPADPHSGGLVFSPPSGTFEGTLSVSISVEDNLEGQIHYTADGSAPTPQSPVYSDPIAISDATEIQASLFQDGIQNGWGTGVYIPRTGDVSSDLPILVLDNFGAGEPNREYVRTLLMIFEAPGGTASLSAPPDLAARAGFHLRGQSSAEFEKKPYRLEIRDRNDEDQTWTVLGMPPEADWILRGPFADKSLIRDAFHYGLGADMGMAAPRFAFCELYKNLDGDPLDADDYEGVYMVAEIIENAKNRLDLKQLRPEDTAPADITGGYIFKFDWQVDHTGEIVIECSGSADCWRDLELVDPEDITPQQQAWLTDYLFDFNEAIHSNNLADPATGYPAFIDPLSFADQIIINEIGRELDAYIRSAYFYKDRDGPLVAGPLWDYNLSLGAGIGPDSFFGLDNMSIEGWTYEVNDTRSNPSNDWFVRLAAEPGFRSLLAERWRELRGGILSNDALNARIDALAAPLVSGAARNFERWPNLGTQTIFAFDTPVTNTWEEQITYLREWLMERVAWLDTQWR